MRHLESRVQFEGFATLLNGLVVGSSLALVASVRRVELAIQLVALPRGATAAASRCIWYDGRQSLLYAPCAAPYSTA